MEEELEVELDAYKDFDELKPWWCKGSLQERTDKNGDTKFYVNFGRTCGCEATKTTMVTLHKKDTIPLSERQTAAAQKVLDKVRALTRPFRLVEEVCGEGGLDPRGRAALIPSRRACRTFLSPS